MCRGVNLILSMPAPIAKEIGRKIMFQIVLARPWLPLKILSRSVVWAGRGGRPVVEACMAEPVRRDFCSRPAWRAAAWTMGRT